MIAIFTLALLAADANYGATPQVAALRVFDTSRNRQVEIQRTNVMGRFATVLTHGGVFETSSVKVPILVEHFSFGWQALELLDRRCALQAHGIAPRVQYLLLRDMPQPHDRTPCGRVVKDAGPRAQVEAVRRQMRRGLVPVVVVAGNDAVGTWYGAGGGESLFRHRDGRWGALVQGGGSLGVAGLRSYGVPQSEWCALSYHTHCSLKPAQSKLETQPKPL